MLAIADALLPATDQATLEKVYAIENHLLSLPQVEISTAHTIHAGIYSRTIMIPAGTVLTGALIKIPTTLIVSGDCLVTVDDKTKHIVGHHVFCAHAGRKQVFVANQDTHLTMLFCTDAKTVNDAERQFTDEWEMLFSNTGKNTVVITEV